MFVQLIAIILFLGGLSSAVFWRGDTVEIMIYNLSEAAKEAYYKRVKQASLAIISVSIVFLLGIGRLADFNAFNVIFYLCFIPLAMVVIKSFKRKTPLWKTDLFTKGRFHSVLTWILNFFVVEIPLSYVYIVVLVNLFITFAQGAPGMYQ